MAEVSGDRELQAGKPPPKRRRILDPSAIVPVPIYSNKVSSGLQLKAAAATFTQNTDGDGGGGGDGGDVDENLWPKFSQRQPAAVVAPLSDSEEDEVELMRPEPKADRCPSPPPPDTPVQKQPRQVTQRISEVDRKLQAVSSVLSPEPHGRRLRCRHGRRPPDDDVIYVNPNDDVIVVDPDPGPEDFLYSTSVREIPLKIRCRADIHKIPVLSSTPLSDVLTQLSVLLDVPPPRLLLTREELELPTSLTVGELGLGIADIIECVVMAAEGHSDDVITVRLQSKDRDSSQEFSVHRDAPLGSIFSRYVASMASDSQRKVSFHFDGSTVTASQTPAQLDMEDGDFIEVWT